MRKFAVAAITGAALVAIPATTGWASPVSDGFLTIGGPDRLRPQGKLRIPIRCSVECDTTVYTTLRIPGPNIGPDKTTGHLQPGKGRKLIVTLNNSATQAIQENYGVSRLRVAVAAKAEDSGKRARAVKVFRFKAP